MIDWPTIALESRVLLLVGGVTLIAGLALGAWLWRRRRRRLRKRARTRRAHPIVLVHGLLGFDELKVGNLRQEYFKGIPTALTKMGGKVICPRMPPTASVADRAEALARCVRELDADKVHLIAHSMGGLDARYAVARLGLAAKVASVTTIGTPHLGTPLADVATSVLGERLRLRQLLTRLGIPLEAFYDLTTARLAAFNEAVADVNGVSYATVVASVPGVSRALNPLLVPAYLLLSERDGPNDGLVPVRSQRWGEVLSSVEADHWAQVGWSKRFDAVGLYTEIVRELTARDL